MNMIHDTWNTIHFERTIHDFYNTEIDLNESAAGHPVQTNERLAGVAGGLAQSA